MKRSCGRLALAWCIPLMACTALSPSHAQESAPASEEKKSGTMVRFLCVIALSDKDDVVLASKTEDGQWVEHGAITLRSSFITPWMKAVPGTMYLARRKGDELAPVASLTVPDKSRRSIVVLLPDPAKNVYSADFIDPEKLGFKKGMALVTNYSKLPAMVMLGNKRTQVKPGGRAAERPVAGADGMYRMVVGYQNEKKELIPCYDRYISSNPDARDILLLFPDATIGLRVYSLSEFGPFE